MSRQVHSFVLRSALKQLRACASKTPHGACAAYRTHATAFEAGILRYACAAAHNRCQFDEHSVTSGNNGGIET